MRVILKGVPPSLNKFVGKAGGWEYREAKSTWTQMVWALSRKSRPAEPYEKAAVTITYYFPDNRRRDADNYCGKLLLDGLTKAKVIMDDDFRHIELTVRGRVDHKNPRTEIEVEPI